MGMGMPPNLSLGEAPEGRVPRWNWSELTRQHRWLRQAWPALLFPCAVLATAITQLLMTFRTPFHSHLMCIGYERRSFSFPKGGTWGLCNTDKSHYLLRLYIRKDACSSKLYLTCPNVRNSCYLPGAFQEWRGQCCTFQFFQYLFRH